MTVIPCRNSMWMEHDSHEECFLVFLWSAAVFFQEATSQHSVCAQVNASVVLLMTQRMRTIALECFLQLKRFKKTW